MKHTIELSDVQPYVKYENTLASSSGCAANKKLIAVMDVHGVVYTVYDHHKIIKETSALGAAIEVYNNI